MIETRLEKLIQLARQGTKEAIENIMINLDLETTLQETREIDYALSQVESEEGIESIKYYLFHGTQIQRNYAALYLGRVHDYVILREAFNMGLIDEIQAFSR